MTSERAKWIRRIVLGLMLLVLFTGQREHFYRINVDSLAKRSCWRVTVLGIPLWSQVMGEEIHPGYRREYQAVFGHAADESREWVTRPDGEHLFLSSRILCGSYGSEFHYRRQSMERLFKAYREGRLDAAAVREFFNRLDALIPMVDHKLKFAPGAFAQIPELQQEIERLTE